MASHTEKKLKAKIRDQKEELNMAWDRVQDAEDQVAQAESENNDLTKENALLKKRNKDLGGKLSVSERKLLKFKEMMAKAGFLPKELEEAEEEVELAALVEEEEEEEEEGDLETKELAKKVERMDLDETMME